MSWFPILVLYVESNERVVCNDIRDIRNGVVFKVLETRYNDECKTVTVHEGEPCIHPGCLQHISHPCEVCHRVAGKGVAVYDIESERRKWGLKNDTNKKRT